jgi:hypothetical protein
VTKVSKVVDPFIAVYADSNPFWTIFLSNGECIYQDDDRPGLEISSAWKRARSHIYENDLEIDKVIFRFAGYEHEVYNRENDKTYTGFYFSRGKSGFLTDSGSRTIDLYVAGKIYDNMMSVSKFEVPFLKKYECYERKIDANNESSIIFDRQYRV